MTSILSARKNVTSKQTTASAGFRMMEKSLTGGKQFFRGTSRNIGHLTYMQWGYSGERVQMYVLPEQSL